MSQKGAFLKRLKTMSIAGFALATTLIGTGCTEKQQAHRSTPAQNFLAAQKTQRQKVAVQKYLINQKNQRQSAAQNLVLEKWQLSIPKSSPMWRTVGKTGFPLYSSLQQLKDHQEFLNDLLSAVSMGRGWAQQSLESTYARITSDIQLGNPTSKSAVRDAQRALLVIDELNHYDLSNESSRQAAMSGIYSQIIPPDQISKVRNKIVQNQGNLKANKEFFP